VTDLERGEIARRFAAAASWWVATTGPDGPHTVPVWGVVIDDGLVVYGDPGSVRARNLAADPRVVVHLEDASDVLIVHGTARDGGPAGARADVNAAFAAKYAHPDDAEYLPDAAGNAGSRLWVVTPSRAVAWRVVPSAEWET
jgi:hypothetical protein